MMKLATLLASSRYFSTFGSLQSRTTIGGTNHQVEILYLIMVCNIASIPLNFGMTVSQRRIRMELIRMGFAYLNQSKEVWGTCKGLSNQETRSTSTEFSKRSFQQIDVDLLFKLPTFFQRLTNVSNSCIQHPKDSNNQTIDMELR